MRALTRRLISKAIEQVAGSGVGVDANGRLLYPDGLNPARVHRFIELVMAEPFASPKAALEALFRRVDVPERAIEALVEVLTEDGGLQLGAIGRHPIHLAAALPSLRQMSECFRRFLIDGLGLANESAATLEAAAIGTRKGAAAALGCEASWDAILAQGEAVGELARGWREGAGHRPTKARGRSKR
jgi:hypothetical protein